MGTVLIVAPLFIAAVLAALMLRGPCSSLCDRLRRCCCFCRGRKSRAETRKWTARKRRTMSVVTVSDGEGGGTELAAVLPKAGVGTRSELHDAPLSSNGPR